MVKFERTYTISEIVDMKILGYKATTIRNIVKKYPVITNGKKIAVTESVLQTIIHDLTKQPQQAMEARRKVEAEKAAEAEKVKAEAAKLEAEGEAEYMRMLAEAYDTADKKDFYEFTIALDALQQSLTGDEKTIILDADSALAQILTGN